MDLYHILGRYRAVLRQVFIIEAAYPQLAEASALWYLLPHGRPAHMSRPGRYLLFLYRALLATCEEIRQWLSEHDALAWCAATEGEAAFFWEQERTQLGNTFHQVMPALPDFAPASATSAVA